ncbi:MAG: hypothetical protein NWF06_10325 [Candidatus Bathyarchaeota archaeon]|nr:hypothetical protein [Candidatus Bathyarchaeum sp.]
MAVNSSLTNIYTVAQVGLITFDLNGEELLPGDYVLTVFAEDGAEDTYLCYDTGGDENQTHVMSSASFPTIPDPAVFEPSAYDDFVCSIFVTYDTSPLEPSIGEFHSTLATVNPNEYFSLSCVVNDFQGNGTMSNASLELSNDVILGWAASGDSFSLEYDPNNYCILGGSSVSTVLNSTAIRLTWQICFYQDDPLGAVSVVADNTLVFDELDYSGSSSYVGLFTFALDGTGGVSTPTSGDGGGSLSIDDDEDENEEVKLLGDDDNFISPTVITITSNMLNVFLLVGLGLGSVVSYFKGSLAWVVLAFVFGVLAVNFFLLVVVVPNVSDLAFLECWLFKFPSFELSDYPADIQTALQILTVVGLAACCLGAIWGVSRNLQR